MVLGKKWPIIFHESGRMRIRRTVLAARKGSRRFPKQKIIDYFRQV
jgi:hypothetical protein